MTYMLVIAALVAGPLVALFLTWVVALARRPRTYEHLLSPESKVTPLGYWSAEQNRRVAYGRVGQRMIAEQDEETQKLEVRQ